MNDLLTNFIGNDDSNIKLNLGTVHLNYEDSSGGIDKNVKLDTSIYSNYFSLEGLNSNYYRISREDVPKIKGDITKRELVLNIDDTYKIYDGKPEFTTQIKELIKNGKYHFTGTNFNDIESLAPKFTKAIVNNKNSDDSIFKPITLFNLKLYDNKSNDVSKNYNLSSAYICNGKITPKKITPHIICLDKIYDGTIDAPIQADTNFESGLENIVQGDDVNLGIIDNESVRLDNNHTKISTEGALTTAIFNNPNIGSNKTVMINKLGINGSDSNNYVLNNAISNFSANILPREIVLNINKITLHTIDKTFEVNYTLVNAIKEDNLKICYNSNSINDFRVFGGIDKDGNSIHTNENVPDILDLFFNYEPNLNYKFMIPDKEIKKIDGIDYYHYLPEARPAQPGVAKLETEAISVEKTINDESGVYIQLDQISIKNGEQNLKIKFYESKDKTYKLFNGCKVKIKNINLDNNNDKYKNYLLETKECETIIEII